MNKTLATMTVALALVSASTARASGFESTETVVHDTTVSVEIELNEDTVLCSAADYGALFLKILIPELAAITLLDHQNFGAGAPCVAAGACFDGNMPADILTTEPTELVDINVKALRQDYIDHDAETCTTSLRETVHVVIRGKEFTHDRFANLGTRPYADCLLTSDPEPPVAPEQPTEETDDVPADAPAPYVPERAEPAGCSAATGNSSAAFALALGLLLSLRRRRD